MTFPEELDDRPFRLFVQRTCYFIKKNLALSAVEKELADLIKAYPELGFLTGKAEVNVNERFPSAESNPFMILGSLWQVSKQLADDKPKGIRNVVFNATKTELLDRETLLILAGIYLAFYLKSREENSPNDRDYLFNVQELLANPNEIEYGTEEFAPQQDAASAGLITEPMMQAMFGEVLWEMHEETSSDKISPDGKTLAFFKKLPIEWVNAAAQYWGLEPIRLKRDRITALIAFLQDNKNAQTIRQSFDDEEMKALSFILSSDGWVKYGALKKRYGTEEQDGYFWTEEPPLSVIGRLRMKGLLFVGETPIGSRYYKVAVIPKEFRAMLANFIKS
jgi:hypothetical protein